MRKQIFTALLVLMLSSVALGLSGPELFEVTNKGVVKIIAGSRTGTYTNLADDMRRELGGTSAGGSFRVVPMVGQGSWQNLIDLQYLHGVDVALVQHDVLEAYKSADPRISDRVRYIAKLHDEEIHLLARGRNVDIRDLAGKKIAIGNEGSGTAMTARTLLELARLRVTTVFMGSDDALAALKEGEIDAMFYVAGKPVGLFAGIEPNSGLSLVKIDTPAVKTLFKPVRITRQDYPNLVGEEDVSTVAVQAILAVYNFSKTKASLRLENIERFTEALYSARKRFSNAKSKYHKKWLTIDLCESVAGWELHPAAKVARSRHCSGTNDYSGMTREELIQMLQRQGR